MSAYVYPAAISLVPALMYEIIAEHLEAHVSRAGLDDAERAAGAKELLAVIRRYSK